MPENVGRYRIVRQIGEGGMGLVYEAWDDRLDRAVAIKTVRHATDPTVRERLVREARAAAAISHPGICQIFEIGDDPLTPYLVMELLEGEPLGERLRRGPLPLEEAIGIASAALTSLAALHQRGIIHRDLKPSNIFLTPHGVKLLDFGLARGAIASADLTGMTMPGVVLGTPRYMAPEQARGESLDARADVFSMGAVLFEMLSGRPAFQGDTSVDVLHAVLHDQPPALVGSATIADIDRVIHRALSKDPVERYATADAMLADLKRSVGRTETTTAATPRTTTRLMVLPFRLLRPDQEIDFLSLSLADAITVALSGIESLVLRSSFAAARFANETDLRTLASEAAVDAVVMGTLLRAGTMLRVSVQLVETPSGTALWSHAIQVPTGDLFQIQDQIAAAVVEALSLPISARESRMLRRDVPSKPEAYELYLRANQIADTTSNWQGAVELYRQSLAADPDYAPAWARMARCLRLMGKYGDGPESERWVIEAEDAFQRAFELNPDLSIAHNLYTGAEVDGGRPRQAMLRLLGRLRHRSSDAELFAGLVHACRYCGLLDASLAADRNARRIDPAIRTSVAHTYFQAGDFERAMEADIEYPPFVTLMAQISLGRRDDVAETFRRIRSRPMGNNHLALLFEIFEALFNGRQEGVRAGFQAMMSRRAFSDPEGWMYWGAGLAAAGDRDGALEWLARAVARAHYCPTAYENIPPIAALGPDPRLDELIQRARAGHEEARRAFVQAEGPRLLGL